MTLIASRLIAILLLSLSIWRSSAQLPDQSAKEVTASAAIKPFKILTSGKQITIKSTKPIKQVMLWTTGGDRVLEDKEVNASTYSFTIEVNQKNFFLMVTLDGGRVYTEKLGIR